MAGNNKREKSDFAEKEQKNKPRKQAIKAVFKDIFGGHI